ncbi:MAG: glycosyltransferase family 1 protein [Alphaproteobacteria bacterium]|nr:glycosyltransferase family 1 protein [Alphaproteobacteria bacterium]
MNIETAPLDRGSHGSAGGAPPARRPLRILLLSYRSDPYTGGQGVYMRHFSRALVEMGHHVDVISGPPYPHLDPRVGLIKLPSLDLYAAPRPELGLPRERWKNPVDWIEYFVHLSGGFPEIYTFGRRLADYMKGRAHEYDLVHDNQTICPGLLDLMRMGLPVVSIIHHPITMDRRLAIAAQTSLFFKFMSWRWHRFVQMQIRVARKLPNIIAVSRSTHRDLMAQFGVRPEQMEIISEGIDCETYRPMPEIPRRPNRLMATASADVALKGLVYLVQAYDMLLRDFPDLELVVVGKLRSGPTEKLLDRLGIKSKVRFVSGITDDEIRHLYAETTIAVSPSLYEGFGFPAGEAMACGVPLVATTGGALPEVVGDAGVIVPAGDAGALARAIADLLRDPARRDVLGQLGRERVLREFSWPLCARNLTEYYYRLLDKHAHRPD